MINTVSQIVWTSFCILNHYIQALLPITINFYIDVEVNEYIYSGSCVVIGIAVVPMADSNYKQIFHEYYIAGTPMCA